MRQAIRIAAVLLVAGSAEAQVVNLLTCTVQSSISPISPGATCTYGGIRVTCQPLAGSATNTDYCFPGNTGPTGDDGESVTGSSEPPGSNCAEGGMAYELGGFTSYVCNGATGSAGAAGASVTSATESPGANCTTGGSRFTVSGSTTYACNGAVGATGSVGSTGPQGPAGQAGSDAPRLVYVDQADAEVTGLRRLDGEAAYWDGNAH